MADEALLCLNVWYESYRCAYVEWCDLAACVCTALNQLRMGEDALARTSLEDALRDHSPPIDG